MRNALATVFLIALVAACGGGGGDDVASGGDGNGNGGGNGGGSPPPVEQPQVPLVLEYLDSNRIFIEASAAPRLIVARSVDEYRALPPFEQRVAPPPPDLAASDFEQYWLLYLEYRSVQPSVNSARIGIERIETSSDGSVHTIFAEFCVLPPENPRLDPRPYSMYKTSRFTGTVEVRWAERSASECLVRHEGTIAGLTPDPIPLQLVAAGDVDLRFAWNRGPLVVRSSEQWAEVRRGITGPLPAAYENPDFARINLIYLETFGDWGVDSYVRIRDVYVNADRSYRLIRTEYCGYEEGMSTHRPFAIYETEVLPGTVEFENLSSSMERCLTQR